jgi:signal transduction histidine kinase
LYYYSISTRQPEGITTVLPDIKAIFKIASQLYYLDAQNHLFAFDVRDKQFRIEEVFDKSSNHFIIQEENTRLFWQSGMESPVLLQNDTAWVIEQDRNKQLVSRLIATGIPGNTLFNYVQYKKEGDYLFLGTDSKGIYIIHKNQLTTKKPAEGNINQRNSFYSQIELPNGNIITSDGKVIGDVLPADNYNIGDNFLNTIFQFNDSMLILVRFDTVMMYNKRTAEKKVMFSTAAYEHFSFAVSGGRLYFVNHKGIGIIKKNNTLEFLRPFKDRDAAILEAGLMMESAPGKLALATCAGLLEFDIRTKVIDTLLKIPSVCIRNLYKEGNYIFIGTYGGGFYVMKNGRIKAIPLDVNRYLRYTHCFMKDEEGFCWISSNNGLFKVKMSDITDAYEKNTPEIYYHYIGKEEGMETIEMNGGCTPCALRLSNGNFSFPTMDGMLWFKPEKVNLMLPEGDLYIDRVDVDNKQQFPTANRSFLFEEGTKKIDISLVTNAWCRKENLYIEYKLDNDNWLHANIIAGEPVIGFSNLSYGKYILQVRKLNGFGANNYSYVTIAFAIATPFYHQWWFRILVLLAIAGATFALFRHRLRQYNIREKKLSALVEEKTKDLNIKNIQLEKNDEIKTRLISVINHDIITPLRFMHYAAKTLVQNKGLLDKEEEHQTISEITQTAKDMEMLSSQILSWIIYQNPNERMEKEEFDLHQLVEMVFSVLQFPAKLKNTKLVNEVPVNFVAYQYLEPLRVLVYNLTMNSINFTKEGTVSVKSNVSESGVVIQVADSGFGMTQAQIDNIMSDQRIITSANLDNKKGTGLGYMIIKDLLTIMKGTFFIESSRNKGTTVSVILPWDDEI